MEKKNGVLWIGGDKRQIIAENSMYRFGFKTSVCLNRESDLAKGSVYSDWRIALSENNILVFPLPMAKESIYLNAQMPILLSELIDSISPNTFVLGGKIPQDICTRLAKRQIRFVDYYNDEFQIENALPTAEGAIGIALCEMPILLSGASCFVVGYGRIARVLSMKLQLLGAKVTVGARKPTDLATARANGHEIISIEGGIPHELPHFDVIFNTAPVYLFGREALSSFEGKTLYIELASFPYGIDQKEAEAHKIRVIQAQSLPGKYSPISAGRLLAENVVRILSKEDITP